MILMSFALLRMRWWCDSDAAGRIPAMLACGSTFFTAAG